MSLKLMFAKVRDCWGDCCSTAAIFISTTFESWPPFGVPHTALGSQSIWSFSMINGPFPRRAMARPLYQPGQGLKLRGRKVRLGFADCHVIFFVGLLLGGCWPLVCRFFDVQTCSNCCALGFHPKNWKGPPAVATKSQDAEQVYDLPAQDCSWQPENCINTWGLMMIITILND